MYEIGIATAIRGKYEHKPNAGVAHVINPNETTDGSYALLLSVCATGTTRLGSALCESNIHLMLEIRCWSQAQICMSGDHST